ncbi:metabolite traffic protein EboE [Phormidesmis priestleyi]
MRVDHQFHLTYCTNIHPGETWAEVWTNLQHYLPKLKQAISPDQPFGVGLRLADVASRELLQGDCLSQFKSWLAAEDLYVFTLNGFPYGSFHHQVVKDQVYAPDWTVSNRLEYTQRLIQILAELLPAGMEGSISTLPLSYKPWFFDKPEQMEQAFQSSTIALSLLVVDLFKLYAETGKLIHLGLEPEPDGLLENTQEVIDFFDHWLRPLGSAALTQQLGIAHDEAVQHLCNHIRVCYDTCHFAVEYEEPAIALRQLQNAGIRISKIQLSSAVRIPIPIDLTKRQAIALRLSSFAESTYLHQVIARQPDGSLKRYRDLEQALPDFLTTTATEWRTHFHVPIFLQDYPLLRSTQPHLTETLNYLQTSAICTHLEIETYTWDVLPADIKLDLTVSIQREYGWVLQQLKAAIAA